MNILIFTNTFTPHVGGVARSVTAFTAEYRKRGHRVLIVAPRFHNMPEHEVDVVRVPAILNFNASEFSVALPPLTGLGEKFDAFEPDLVHSQHPFLLGMTALRFARYRKLPLCFTHHTLYEQYTHYVPGDSPAMKRFVIELATRYANLCDQVFAPSDSVRSLLHTRGVNTPIAVVPTGVPLEHFAHGDRHGMRQQLGIPQTAFVVGHMGRLAPEKNLGFLTEAVINFMHAQPQAHFLLVGTGPCEQAIRTAIAHAGLDTRLHLVGTLQQQPLADALHAMDVFVFASKSETQGMVLTEAMAAGLPVVALDASGVREVVVDGKNGRLLQEQGMESFSAALQQVAGLAITQKQKWQQAARATAETFSMPRTADRALANYQTLIAQARASAGEQVHDGEDLLAWIKTEWGILKTVAGASDAAMAAVMNAVLDSRDSAARDSAGKEG